MNWKDKLQQRVSEVEAVIQKFLPEVSLGLQPDSTVATSGRLHSQRNAHSTAERLTGKASLRSMPWLRNLHNIPHNSKTGPIRVRSAFSMCP